LVAKFVMTTLYDKRRDKSTAQLCPWILGF